MLTADYAKGFDFYKNVLGLELVFGDEASGYAGFLAGADTSAVALMDKLFLAKVLSDKQSVKSDTFNLTFTVPSVDEVHDTLTAKGIQFVTFPTTYEEMGGRTAHFRDPDGNLIELYEAL